MSGSQHKRQNGRPADSPAGTATLFQEVYEELRALAQREMAHERVGHTLQPTALVHEAFLRLAAQERPRWPNRAYFFAAAAEAMRRILVERARRYRRVKHGGGRRRTTLIDLPAEPDSPPLDVLALNEALTGLEAMDRRKSEIVKLRYFAGRTIEETAELLDVSPGTVKSEWRYAKAWLHRAMEKIRD